MQTEIVRGQPFEAGGHTLIPVARRTTGVWQQATIGASRVEARGGAAVTLRPLGLIEPCGDKQRFIATPDRTEQILWGLLAVALVAPLLFILVGRLLRPVDES